MSVAAAFLPDRTGHKIALAVAPVVLYVVLVVGLFVRCLLGPRPSVRGLLVEHIHRSLTITPRTAPRRSTVEISVTYKIHNVSAGPVYLLPPFGVSSKRHLLGLRLEPHMLSPEFGHAMEVDYKSMGTELWRLDQTDKSKRARCCEIGYRLVPPLEKDREAAYRIVAWHETDNDYLAEPQQFAFSSVYERLVESNELRVSGDYRIKILGCEVIDLTGDPVAREKKRIAPPNLSPDGTRINWTVQSAVVGYVYCCHYILGAV